MKRLDTWQSRVVVTVIFIVFIVLVLPYVSKVTKEVTGMSESPDTAFFYESEKLFEMAEDYGESGRKFYIFLRWTFDVVWPFVYGSFLVVMMRWVFHGSGFTKLTLLPIAGVIFDFLENISVSLVFWIYPTRLEWLAAIAPYITSIKWMAIGLSFILLITGAIWSILGKNRE